MIKEFLNNADLQSGRRTPLILCGAGSSEYIGNAVAYGLRKRMKRSVTSVPTTDFLLAPWSFMGNGNKPVVVSFARSGNSPESAATYNLVKQCVPDAKQIVITTNNAGQLARLACQDSNTLCLVLPAETNDRSLVMTSSFSTMAMTAIGLCFLDFPDELRAIALQLGQGARRIFDNYADVLKQFITQPAARICYLGSNALFGTMKECRLKMLEMTEGKMVTHIDSFLGFRHGPQVFVNQDCLVVAAISSDPYVRNYEIDLLRELRRKKQGRGMLVICDHAVEEIRSLSAEFLELYPDGNVVEDDYRVMTDVIVGQILGMFKSLDVGLKPDNPSTNGTINRVVQGVTIYPLERCGHGHR